MEAWKLSTPDILKYPVPALNLTTERWRLQPFPENLVAVKGSWNSSDPNNALLWDDDLLVPCPGDLSRLCGWNRTCTELSCAIVVEGIGAITTGPAHSDIIGLVHGLIAFIVFIITTAVIMGCCQSIPREDPQPQPVAIPAPQVRPLRAPQPSALELDHTLNQFYARPQRLPTQRAIEISWATAVPTNEDKKTKQIARATALLREMYALELLAWSMEGVELHAKDKGEPAQLRRRAQSIFQEVQEFVSKWRGAEAIQYWSPEERKIIDAIDEAIQAHRGVSHPSASATIG